MNTPFLGFFSNRLLRKRNKTGLGLQQKWAERSILTALAHNTTLVVIAPTISGPLMAFTHNPLLPFRPMLLDTTNSSDRKVRILHEALLLFTEKGYANTSVHEIRERADVSIGLVYRYFKNKEEIARALYRELLNDVTTNTQRIIEENETIAEKCRAIISAHFERTEKFPEMVDFVLFFRHWEMFSDAGAICDAQPATLVYTMVKEAIEKGELRKMHPAVAQTALFGGATRLMRMRILGVLSTPLPELLDEVWECSWRSVRP